MIKIYSADIRCCNDKEPSFAHVDSMDEEVTIGEMLIRLKKQFDEFKIRTQLIIEDEDGTRHIAKYKFGNDITCLRDFIEKKVESLWRIGDDGGATVIIKILKEQ